MPFSRLKSSLRWRMTAAFVVAALVPISLLAVTMRERLRADLTVAAERALRQELATVERSVEGFVSTASCSSRPRSCPG